MSYSIILSIFCVFAIYIYRRWLHTDRKLPPGPKPVPLLGNILDGPPKGVPEFRHWMKHREIYGPISSITVLDRTVVFIHDVLVAKHLLDTESVHSSYLPPMEFAFSLCGYNDIMVRRYNDDFRFRRKLMHQQLGSPTAVAVFNNIQELEVRRFLLRLSNQPEGLMDHIKKNSAAMMLKMTYGYAVEPHQPDPLVELADRMVKNLTLATVPLGWLVDIIPALNYLPAGLPGTGFKDIARQWRKVNRAAVDVPYSFVRQQMARGDNRESYVARLVRSCGNGDTDAVLAIEDELSIKRTAASMYLGGVDGISITVTSFFLAMVMYPEVQRQAQLEIDRLTAGKRLPTLADRENLPYVNGIVSEAFRWSPVGPLGFPHMTSKEMVYHGYTIPIGATIVPTIWWFLHDPEVYSDPETFSPERYLPPRNEPDPKSLVFGFGRRVCPGRYFADPTVFLTIVQTLAVFKICNKVDENGRETKAELKVSCGIGSHIEPFPYSIIPRSEKHSAFIESLALEIPCEGGDSHYLNTGAIKECLGN